MYKFRFTCTGGSDDNSGRKKCSSATSEQRHKAQQIFREQIHRIKNLENNLRQKNKSAHISQNSAGYTRRTCIHQILSANLTIRKAECLVGSNQTAVLLHHTGYRRQADENGNNEKYHREHRTDRLNRRRIALHIGITAQRRAILYIPLCHINVRYLLLFLRNRLIEVRKIFFIFCLAVRVFRLTFKQLFPSFGEIFLTVLYLRRSLLFLLRQLRLAFGKRHTAVLQLCSLIGNLRFSEDDLCFPFVQFVPCRIKLLPCRLFCRIQLRLCLAERLDCRPHISQSHCKLYQLIGCGLLQRLQKRTLAVRHQSRHRRLCLRGILLCDHRSCYG